MKTFLDNDRQKYGRPGEYEIVEGEADELMDNVMKAVTNAKA